MQDSWPDIVDSGYSEMFYFKLNLIISFSLSVTTHEPSVLAAYRPCVTTNIASSKLLGIQFFHFWTATTNLKKPMRTPLDYIWHECFLMSCDVAVDCFWLWRSSCLHLESTNKRDCTETSRPFRFIFLCHYYHSLLFVVVVCSFMLYLIFWAFAAFIV